MADNDDRPENDIADPTSDEHGDVHHRFVELWNERASGDAGALALDSAWQPIANMLENHAGAQVEGADPALPKEGNDGATEGTNDTHPAEEERDVMPDVPGTAKKRLRRTPVHGESQSTRGAIRSGDPGGGYPPEGNRF